MKAIRQGKNIILEPPRHLRTLVWLHGLGDSADGFLPLFENFQVVDDCKIVLLTAPIRPVTLNMGFEMTSWYDIAALGRRDMNEQVVESAGIISEGLDEERKLTDEVALGGFSQGGAMSLYTGLVHYPHPLKGIVSLSGYTMNYQIREDRKNIPVFLYNGKEDQMVSFEMAQEGFETTLRGANYEFHSEESLGHSISQSEIATLSEWFKKVFNLQL